MTTDLHTKEPQGAQQSNDVPLESHLQDAERWFIYKLGKYLNLFEEAAPTTERFMADGSTPEGEALHFLKTLELRAAKLCKLLEDAGEQEPEAVDMQIVIGVSHNGQEAWAFALPPLGKGKKLNQQELEARIAAEGVCFGLTAHDFLKETVAGNCLRLFVIARGIPPQDGQDGKVTECFLREKQIHLTAVENGVVDYKNLHWLQTVSAGETICTLVQPGGEADGRTVKGGTVKARRGKMPPIPAGSNTKVNPEQTALVAACDGQLNFYHKAFHVEKILKIRGDVDISVGNLDVLGDLDIKGSVRDGFTVKATGNIVVHGLVEGACLEAGGNIQIILGVKGNGKGEIHAQGDVVCKYLENAKVRAGKNVVADNIINSNVYAGAMVLARAGNGAIIGGKVAAGNKISAKKTGNESCRATELIIGEDPNSLKAAAKLRKEAELLLSEINETMLNINYLEKKDKAEKLPKLRLKLSVHKMAYEKKLKQIEATRVNTENVDNQVAVDIIYPQTGVEIYGSKMVFHTQNRMCRIYKLNGELQVGRK